MLVTLAFAAHKSTELFDPRNPTIIETTEQNAIGNSREDFIVLKDIGFKFAFNFGSMNIPEDVFEVKNDPQYVQWDVGY